MCISGSMMSLRSQHWIQRTLTTLREREQEREKEGERKRGFQMQDLPGWGGVGCYSLKFDLYTQKKRVRTHASYACLTNTFMNTHKKKSSDSGGEQSTIPPRL